MVVSINDSETTLWDQFEYAGDPDDFVWVLPVSGGEEVDIGLADQSFFQYLADQTAVTLTGPAPRGSSSGFSLGCAASSAPASADETRSVTVYSSEVVGPYETAVIGSEDANSLTDWLAENGYVIPEALEPTIAHYVDEGMSFAVLRLAPNAGVSQMQPVRVTTPGTHVSFPLRMVAAGIAESVALELYIIAEGRWEAQNFPNAMIPASELAYDLNAGIFNYDEVAADLLAAGDGRTWLTEFSDLVYGPSVGAVYYTDDTGEHSPYDDWYVATRDLPGSTDVTVTRMRADLPANALAEDLILQASTLAPVTGQYFVNNSYDSTDTSEGSSGGALSFLFLLAGVIAFVSRPRRWRHAHARS